MSDGATMGGGARVMNELGESLGLRERRKAEARARIIQSALAMFRERGYVNVTVDQIAEHASVSRRSFFRYFPSKESVVMDRRLAQLGLLREMLEKAPRSATAGEVLRGAFAVIASDFERNRARILSERSLFSSARELKTRDMEIDRDFEVVLRDAILARTHSPEAERAELEQSARIFAAAAMGALRVLLDDWAASQGTMDLIRAGEPVFDVLEQLIPSAARSKSAASA
ncbi:MAG: TetR family transcriptional regulator [Polyangiaceae bacterium]